MTIDQLYADVGRREQLKNRRVHRITHPTHGPVSQAEIRALSTPKHCIWCSVPLTGRCFSRCRSKECHDALDRLFNWNYTKKQVFRRDGLRCGLCGSTDAPSNERTWNNPYEVDHIIPICLGGTDDLENLRILCSACHKAETVRLRRERQSFSAMRANS
jgi:5-methylcytosine-specific restriction endonuclease McrA